MEILSNIRIKYSIERKDRDNWSSVVKKAVCNMEICKGFIAGIINR